MLSSPTMHCHHRPGLPPSPEQVPARESAVLRPKPKPGRPDTPRPLGQLFKKVCNDKPFPCSPRCKATTQNCLLRGPGAVPLKCRRPRRRPAPSVVAVGGRAHGCGPRSDLCQPLLSQKQRPSANPHGRVTLGSPSRICAFPPRGPPKPPLLPRPRPPRSPSAGWKPSSARAGPLSPMRSRDG